MEAKEKLLRKCGFLQNTYEEGQFWELVVDDDDERKRRICEAFGTDKELGVSGDDIDTLILQCDATLGNCVFNYDLNLFYMSPYEFIRCLEKLSEVESSIAQVR